MKSSHIDRRPLYRIDSKSYRGRLCDICKYRIVVQRIDMITYLNRFTPLDHNHTSVSENWCRRDYILFGWLLSGRKRYYDLLLFSFSVIYVTDTRDRTDTLVT